jgi:hypothetical protein
VVLATRRAELHGGFIFIKNLLNFTRHTNSGLQNGISPESITDFQA